MTHTHTHTQTHAQKHISNKVKNAFSVVPQNLIKEST